MNEAMPEEVLIGYLLDEGSFPPPPHIFELHKLHWQNKYTQTNKYEQLKFV